MPLISSKNAKARWNTILLIADKIPGAICSILPKLKELIERDKSTIVRVVIKYEILLEEYFAITVL